MVFQHWHIFSILGSSYKNRFSCSPKKCSSFLQILPSLGLEGLCLLVGPLRPWCMSLTLQQCSAVSPEQLGWLGCSPRSCHSFVPLEGWTMLIFTWQCLSPTYSLKGVFPNPPSHPALLSTLPAALPRSSTWFPSRCLRSWVIHLIPDLWQSFISDALCGREHNSSWLCCNNKKKKTNPLELDVMWVFSFQ